MSFQSESSGALIIEKDSETPISMCPIFSSEIIFKQKRPPRASIFALDLLSKAPSYRARTRKYAFNFSAAVKFCRWMIM